MGYSRFVALGDSLTLGVGDPYRDGRPRGFADLLAGGLRDRGDRLAYANLARPSVRTAEVLQTQVPEAVALRPDLVTVVVGANDVIALRFDAVVVARVVDRALAALRQGCPNATILTATMPDLRHLNALARRWRGRTAALDEAIRRAAARHRVHVVDVAVHPALGPSDLAPDRVHPSPHGHLRLARAFGAVLSCPVPEPRHMAPPGRPEVARRACRAVAVAPRFVARRMARGAFIAAQPPKRPLLPALREQETALSTSNL